MKSVTELVKEADIYVAHLNKPMTDDEVRLAFLEHYTALVRAEYEALLKLAAEALVYHTQMTRPIHKTNEALTAIHEALAEPVQEHESREDIAAKEMFGGFSKAWAAPVKQEPVAWDLAEKVRRDLDRKSCPDAYMRIAMESIVKHYAAAIRGMK